MQHQNQFPGVADRFKAIFVDTMVLIGFALAISFIFESFQDVSDSARIIAFVAIFFAYDPMMTSFLGGTLGHFALGLRVRRMSNQSKKILLPFAILRYITKASLGWISMLTVGSNRESRAIHDYVGGSIVIYANQKVDDPFGNGI